MLVCVTWLAFSVDICCSFAAARRLRLNPDPSMDLFMAPELLGEEYSPFAWPEPSSNQLFSDPWFSVGRPGHAPQTIKV